MTIKSSSFWLAAPVIINNINVIEDCGDCVLFNTPATDTNLGECEIHNNVDDTLLDYNWKHQSDNVRM